MLLPKLGGFWLLPPRDFPHIKESHPYGSRQQFIWTHTRRSLLMGDPMNLWVYSSNGRRARWCERISTVSAESSDYGVNLRTVQNLFFEQLLRNFMEQTKISR